MGTGSSLLWVLEIKLRSSGLAASAFTLHAIPLLSVEYDSADENGSSPALLRNDTIFLRRMLKELIQCRIQIALLLLTYIRLWLFRLHDEFGVCFVTLPQEEGLPGFRGVRSAGPKEQSLRETPDYQQWIQATFHFSRSSLQALANLNKKLTGHIEEKKDPPPTHTRSMGLLLCSAGDLFPLMIPRWRWGMRILQGNSSPPLGNRPSPDFSEPTFLNPARKTKAQRLPPYIKNRRKAAAIVALTF